MQIQGTKALLTGATGGLGMAIARTLAGRGATLVLSSRKGDELEQLAASLPGSGHRTIVSDQATEGAGEALVAAAEEEGPLDIFVANAALPGSGRLEDLTPEGVTRVLRVNLEAPIRATRALLPGMLERRRGHFVFISSLAGKVAPPRASMYSATKYGLRGFSQSLGQDLHGTGVGSSLVLPGFIRGAGMFADSGMEAPAGVGTGTPEQVGEAVASGIEAGKAEIVVAPPQTRLISGIGSAFPGLAARAQRGRGERVAEELAAKQADKR